MVMDRAKEPEGLAGKVGNVTLLQDPPKGLKDGYRQFIDHTASEELTEAQLRSVKSTYYTGCACVLSRIVQAHENPNEDVMDVVKEMNREMGEHIIEMLTGLAGISE